LRLTTSRFVGSAPAALRLLDALTFLLSGGGELRH
jgi:hypothetical protein